MPSYDQCEEVWGQCTIYPNFILPILYALSTIITTPAMYLYIKAFMQGNLKSPRALFWAAFLLFAAIYVTFVYSGISYALRCRGVIINGDRANRWGLHEFQGLLVAVNLFLRLIFIFKDTAFSVSKCTITTFFVSTTVMLSTWATGFILMFSNAYSLIGVMLLSLASLIYIVVVIWLNVLFIHRMIVVHKAARDSAVKNDRLMHIATKNALLCLLSTWTFLTTVAFMAIVAFVNPSPHLRFVQALLVALDVWSNFLSILLTFTYFQAMYMRLFGCCHSKCSSFLMRCVAREKTEKLEMEITAQIEEEISESP